MSSADAVDQRGACVGKGFDGAQVTLRKFDVECVTVETVHGTRYPMRRRENGIWGLTQFTPLLDAEAERAARDYAVIDKAAADYQRAK